MSCFYYLGNPTYIIGFILQFLFGEYVVDVTRSDWIECLNSTPSVRVTLHDKYLIFEIQNLNREKTRFLFDHSRPQTKALLKYLTKSIKIRLRLERLLKKHMESSRNNTFSWVLAVIFINKLLFVNYRKYNNIEKFYWFCGIRFSFNHNCG